MTRGPLPFIKNDVRCAIEIARNAGMDVGGFKVNLRTSEITIWAKGDAPQIDNNSGETNEWDEAYGTEVSKVR
jgi:hypothetical protein